MWVWKERFLSLWSKTKEARVSEGGRAYQISGKKQRLLEASKLLVEEHAKQPGVLDIPSKPLNL